MLRDLASHLARNPQSGIQVAGHIGGPASEGTGIAEPGGTLEDSIQALRPSRVVVSSEGGMKSRLAHELLELRYSGHAIEDAAGTYEKICNREGLSGLNATHLLYSKEFEPGTRARFFQAIGNGLMAAAVLTLLSPVLVLIAALVRLSSREGVIERQLREGRSEVENQYARVVPWNGNSYLGCKVSELES